jgi:hypothetical protein
MGHIGSHLTLPLTAENIKTNGPMVAIFKGLQEQKDGF